MHGAATIDAAKKITISPHVLSLIPYDLNVCHITKSRFLDIVGTVYHLVICIYIYIYVVQQDTQCGLNE